MYERFSCFDFLEKDLLERLAGLEFVWDGSNQDKPVNI